MGKAGESDIPVPRIFGDRIANATTPPMVNGLDLPTDGATGQILPAQRYRGHGSIAPDASRSLASSIGSWKGGVCCVAGQHWIPGFRLRARSTTAFSRDRH